MERYDVKKLIYGLEQEIQYADINQGTFFYATDTGNTFISSGDEIWVKINIDSGNISHSDLALDDGTNPHVTTKADVGLGDVPNTDFTSDVAANTAKVGITTQQATDITTNNAKTGVTDEEENTINTELEDGMTGEDLVLNVLSLTTAEYDAGTPISTTLYIITDA